ncbi:hypothetical protein V6N13_091329 [Hibiscus sabdariffa]|uniref:Uncharacterized protein n=1 Tax=Hibiscus sabdariffa TaxID=183260 RepID=A0ABR2BUP7_9ROSI
MVPWEKRSFLRQFPSTVQWRKTGEASIGLLCKSFRVNLHRSPCSSRVVFPLRFTASILTMVLWMSNFGLLLPCSRVYLKLKDDFNPLIELDS